MKKKDVANEMFADQFEVEPRRRTKPLIINERYERVANHAFEALTCKHTFGGPPTDGTEHCNKCGTVRYPDGRLETILDSLLKREAAARRYFKAKEQSR